MTLIKSLTVVAALLAGASVEAAEAVWLSELDLSKARQGWGTAQADHSIMGTPLVVAGQRFEHGVGTHSPGELCVNLGGRAQSFSAQVGVDDSARGTVGSVVFKVIADGMELWSSGLMRPGDAAKTVEVSLQDVRFLALIVADAGDGMVSDHADWGDAKIVMKEGRPSSVAPESVGKLIAAAKGPQKTWTVRSGSVEYRLRQTEMGLDWLSFGRPTDGAEDMAVRSDFWGRVEGRNVKADGFRVISAKMESNTFESQDLRFVLRHRFLPLEVQARYVGWGSCGVITRQLTLVNKGTNPLHIESWPSLAWELSPGDYELTTLQGGWGVERQVVTEKLGAGPKTFTSPWGRSSSRMSPWFSLANGKQRYLAQLAWSGNWSMSFSRGETNNQALSRQDLRVELGMRFDYGGPLLLAPGKSFELPAVAFTVTEGDLDEGANAMHRYQRQFVIPNNPANDPPLVQFNSWYPFSGKTHLAEMKRYVDAAAELGVEAFVMDSGWYNKERWDREVGDWRPDLKAFPNGTGELARYAHAAGLKFGIWVEIENLGDMSEMARQHSDWCLKRDGQAVQSSQRYQLNFANPEACAWARAEIDRIIQENELDWIKIDYNVDIGEQFDAEDGTRPGDVLYRHVQAYYAWLDALRSAYPRLIIENCSSGGLRFDLGILAHTHTTWISDRVEPKPSLQLAYGSTLEFTPKVCNHWMVGDQENGVVLSTNAPDWWTFMFRVPMNGQFGISSRIVDWNPQLTQVAKDNIALYKRIRKTIVEGDCYHLTPPPAQSNPKGWAAFQYVSADRKKSVIMAYRLGDSKEQITLRTRGLDSDRLYNVFSGSGPKQILTGAQLLGDGLALTLDAPWRSAVVELEMAQ